jgi:replicative DNA helicase
MATPAVHGEPSPASEPRKPPHDLDAEESVIGSMLLSKNAIAEVSELLGPEDFYRGANRTMFEAARELYDRGEPVDPVTLVDELRGRERLDDVGGSVAVHEVASRVPTAANAVYYGQIVADQAMRRRLIEAGTEIAKAGYDDAREADEALDSSENLIYQISQRGRINEFTPIKELMTATIDQIERLHATGSEITGLETGFTDFDKLTSGLQPSNLVVLAARPSMGKSALAMNMATHVAVELRRPAVMFSLEMSSMELMQRVLSGQARVHSDRLRTGRLEESDWPKLSQAMGKLAEAPLFMDDTPGINLMEIRTKCRRLKQTHGLDLVIVDYLQIMQPHRRAENRVQEVSELSRGLKILAKDLDVPVVGLSQLSRKPEDRTDRRPLLSDLRESGSIEQDADVVCFIYRDDVYDQESAARGEAELIVAKHRNGPLSTVKLSFMGHHSRFASLAYSGMQPSSNGPQPGSSPL